MDEPKQYCCADEWGFPERGNQTSDIQEARVPKNRNPYIKRIPEETPTLETTTTIDLDSEKNGNDERQEESSSCRSFRVENSLGSPRDRVVSTADESAIALADQLVLECRLSGKQRQAVIEYCELKGEEYVRSKAAIVRARPRENAAGALMAALQSDWQPPVSIKGKKNATPKGFVRPGNRNIGNSNEHCDFSQYRCSQ
jgi:hypothetical protein